MTHKGIPDYQRAARYILKDFVMVRINYDCYFFSYFVCCFLCSNFCIQQNTEPRYYSVSQKNVQLIIFQITFKNKLILMNFGGLNLEKISHQQLVRLSTSPVYCSHFILGNQKSHFSTVLFIHTSDYLRCLRRKQTITPLPTIPDNLTPYLVKFTNFSSFSFFHAYQVPICDTDELQSVLLRHGLNFSRAWWKIQLSVAKKTGSMYPCRRWLL